MNVDEKISRLIDEALLGLREFTLFEAALNPQSPIENLMRAAFFARQIHSAHWLAVKFCQTGPSIDFNMIDTFPGAAFAEWQLLIWPQVVLGPYRMDFLAMLSLKNDARVEEDRAYLAIECDGHEFHEKTKEQAARDKARDRYMTARHVPVMRFTGSEIWRAPEDCVGEVIKYFEERAVPLLRTA